MIKIATLFFIFNFFVKTHAQASGNITSKIPYEYEMVQTKPQYPGGNVEFMKFVTKNFQTEELEGLSGIIKVSFVIETDGSIKQIKILKDIGGSSASEAKRVVGLLSKWSPAVHNGEKVSVKFEFPITIN